MERRIYNKIGDCIYHGVDLDKNTRQLCSLLWNKYVLKAKEIVKVEKKVYDTEAEIKFVFNNGVKELYTGLPITWGHLYFGNDMYGG